VQATHNATPDQINADWWGRTTRLTNAFSKKAANHARMMAIYVMHDNFASIRQPLEVTPAMAPGVTSKLWEMSDMVELLED
jgi:hypothetical protein